MVVEISIACDLNHLGANIITAMPAWHNRHASHIPSVAEYHPLPIATPTQLLRILGRKRRILPVVIEQAVAAWGARSPRALKGQSGHCVGVQ